MPRDLRPEYDAAVAEKVTAPVFIAEIILKQRTYRFASFDSVVPAFGVQFPDTNLLVTGPTQYSGATLKASLSVPYDTTQNGGRIIDDILAERPQGRSAKLWHTYWHRDSYIEPILLIEGVIASVDPGQASSSKPRVSMQIISKGNHGGVTPFIRIMPPLANFITPSGSVVTIGDNNYEIG
jgi:hypothetical protein